MTTVFRLIGACIACVIAASIGATVVATLAAMADAAGQHQCLKALLMLPESVLIWLLIFAVSWIYSMPAAILVGVPAHFVLRLLRLDVFGAYAIVGAIAGLWIGLYEPPPFPPFHVSLLYTIICTVAGTAGGAAFHAVMRTGAPRSVLP